MGGGEVVGLAQVKDDRLLAAVGGPEQGAFPVRERPDMAVVVAARRLHFHDLRADVGEEHRGEGPRQDSGEVKDGDARQRALLRAHRRVLRSRLRHRQSGMTAVTSISTTHSGRARAGTTRPVET
jgi:hypothetical protein